MIKPILKPARPAKINRGSYAYKKQKKEYLKKFQQHNGMYVCFKCDRWFPAIELDHIKLVGMGGSPSRLMDTNNWQLLCRDCHHKKHNH